MRYTLELSFWNKPICQNCMVAVFKDGHNLCCGLGMRPICPDEGCRKDCPLKEVKE